MALGTITIEAGGHETLPAGMYVCEFGGVADHEITKDGTVEMTTKWTFTVLEGANVGKTIDGLTDAGPARVTNKLGRWLSGLIGKPLVTGLQVTPEDHVGKRYMVVLSPNKNGKVAINTFTPAA